MPVHNIHERRIAAPPARVGEILDTLASGNDRLWPHERWPPMKLDKPLGIGATGGHGPIRYVVEAYDPGVQVVFRFTGPAGFNGSHRYEVEGVKGESSGRASEHSEGEDQDADTDGSVEGGTVLRHVIEMKLSGPALITWPFLYRPLHDALMEDSLGKADADLTGQPEQSAAWSPYVRGIRYVFQLLRGRRRGR